jgi:hypothetical protein
MKPSLELHVRRLLPFCHCVLIDRSDRVPRSNLLKTAYTLAEQLSAWLYGESEHFILIHNGDRLARRRHKHVHILCVRRRWQKALIYFAIGLKNIWADIGGRR